MSDPQFLDPRELRPGPIRHRSLPPRFLELVKAVYDVIGPYLNTTLEQFEIGFMREVHPKIELANWIAVTKGWLAYHEKFVGRRPLPDEVEKKLLAALIAIAAGYQDVSKLDVPVQVGERLRQCYEDPANE